MVNIEATEIVPLKLRKRQGYPLSLIKLNTTPEML
jgi:hypothetical protein